MNREIACSVDSVTELLRRVKDQKDTSVRLGIIDFYVDGVWYKLEFTYPKVVSVEKVMLALKAGDLTHVVLTFPDRFSWLDIYLEEEGEDVDLIEEALKL